MCAIATWTTPEQRVKERNPHIVYPSRLAIGIFVALHTCGRLQIRVAVAL